MYVHSCMRIYFEGYCFYLFTHIVFFFFVCSYVNKSSMKEFLLGLNPVLYMYDGDKALTCLCMSLDRFL